MHINPTYANLPQIDVGLAYLSCSSLSISSSSRRPVMKSISSSLTHLVFLNSFQNTRKATKMGREMLRAGIISKVRVPLVEKPTMRQ